MFSPERIEKLKQIQSYVQEKLLVSDQVNLLFVCVQNSRRSHLAQVIARHSALIHQFPQIHCFSGGVEVTRIHANTLLCLEELGYQLRRIREGNNPVYSCAWPTGMPPLLLYSKSFEEVTEILNHFAVIMVCSETETHCPSVPGAEKKFLLPYPDPGIADEGPRPMEFYLSVAKQMQHEMKYIFSALR